MAIGTEDQIDIEMLKAENRRLKNALIEIIDKGTNHACADALENLWQDVILAHKPNYGDWEYAGMAYRHLLAEFNDLRTERDGLRELYRGELKKQGIDPDATVMNDPSYG